MLKEKLEGISAHNKRKLARHLKEAQGVEINPESIFDIQTFVYEYSQQMNAHVIHKYLTSLVTPARPITVFGKAAPATIAQTSSTLPLLVRSD